MGCGVGGSVSMSCVVVALFGGYVLEYYPAPKIEKAFAFDFFKSEEATVSSTMTEICICIHFAER